MDETIVASGVGSGSATERLLGIAANQYRVVQVGPQQFQFARTYRPLWALMLGIVLLPVLIGIVFFFVKSTDTWVATVEEDHRYVRVRIRGRVLASVLVHLRESLAGPGPTGAPAPAAPMPLVVDQVGVPGAIPAAPAPVAPAPVAPTPAAPLPMPTSVVALPGPASAGPASPWPAGATPAPMAPLPATPPVSPVPGLTPAVAHGGPPVPPSPVSPVGSAVPVAEVPPAMRTPVRPVPVPTRVEAAPVDSMTAARSSLPLFFLTLDTGQEYVMSGRMLVGRDPEVAPGEAEADLLPIDDPDRSISKTHLVMDLGAEGELRVLDRGSTNGTSVERVDGRLEEVPPQASVEVRDGDVVRFGQRHLQVSRRSLA